MNATKYPLSWPTGWQRTKAWERKRAAFSSHKKPLTVWDAIGRVSGELSRLGATDEILSTNVAVRLDGLPRSGQAEPSDPGAAVYFKLKKQDRCLACDRWDRVADNIAAIAQHIDALRRIDRYGVGTMEQAFAGYAALPPTHEDWWLVLGVAQTATDEQIRAAYQALIKVHHPDVGGTHDGMSKINKAYNVAKAR